MININTICQEAVDAKRVSPAAIPVVAPRIEAVDGLRGFAALTVVVYHIFTESHAPELRIGRVNVLRPLHDGWAGVNLFLVLSGFCLYWPYATRPDRPLRTKSYILRRAWRIVPTYYISLAFVSLIGGLWRPFGIAPGDALPANWKDVTLHLMLLHSLTATTLRSWNSVTWSLGLEWFWYMFFPLALLVYNKIGANCGFLMLTFIAVIYRVAVYVCLRSTNISDDVSLAWRAFVLGRLFEFGVGMWVAWRVNQKAVPDELLRWFPVAIVVILAAAHAATPISPLLPVRDILYGTASALLLFAATSPVNNLTRKIFSTRWLCWVGLFSYTLYLFHLPLVVILGTICEKAGFSGVPLFAIMVLLSGAIVLACWLIFQFAEKPFLKARASHVKSV